MKYKNMKHGSFMAMLSLIRQQLPPELARKFMGHSYPGNRTYAACRFAVEKHGAYEWCIPWVGLFNVLQDDAFFLARLKIYSIEDAVRYLAQYIRHPARGITPPLAKHMDPKRLARIASAFGIPVVRIGKEIQFHWGYANDALLDEQAKLVERCASRVAASDLFARRAGGKARGPQEHDPELEKAQGSKGPRARLPQRDKRRVRHKRQAQETRNKNQVLIGFLDDEPFHVEAKDRLA